jgi:hypothetical protein
VPQAKTLCKSLSEIVARCSYAIYLAHSSTVWTHNSDLVVGKQSSVDRKDVDVVDVALKKHVATEPNISVPFR